MKRDKVYLGDGVYAAVERGELVLTTEDGISIQNRIMLEKEVLDNLMEFIRSL